MLRYFQVKECGADASTANKNGWTPVFMAAQNGHTETVRMLVQECGADASTAVRLAVRIDEHVATLYSVFCNMFAR